jgi:hypothetical protein
MSELEIEVARKPFTRWWGPYSPRRGRMGLSLRGGEITVREPASDGTGDAEWILMGGSSVDRFIRAVSAEFGGGRLLFLPSGHIVKPCNTEDETCIRMLVGTYRGSLCFEGPDGDEFDLADPCCGGSGEEWTGPNTIGLECVLKEDGCLQCEWKHPEGLYSNACIFGPSPALASGFRKARPGDVSGRVHVTAHGHVYTKWQAGYGRWRCSYVGTVDPRALQITNGPAAD